MPGVLIFKLLIHFFDFLTWIYGGAKRSYVHIAQPERMSGIIELEKARVKWFLSVAKEDLPNSVLDEGGYAYRSITIDDQEIDLSASFTDLHTEVYKDILAGGGYGINDTRDSIELVYQIRTSMTVSPNGHSHPFLSNQMVI